MPRKPAGEDDDRAPSNETDDERFDRTLRNLLNTPPKPRKADAAKKERLGAVRAAPGRRSAKRQEERGERR